MSLSDFYIARKPVTDGTSSFDVRGLSFADILPVFNSNKEIFREAFDKGVEEAKVKGFSGKLVMDAAMLVLDVAPAAIAELVSRASDEEDVARGAKVFLQLPGGVQIDALTTILELTSISEVELEKLAEVVSTMAGKVIAAAEFVNSPSTIGSSASANK